MLIRSKDQEHILEIDPGVDIALKHSISTHTINGTPEGFADVDMHLPWWGLKPEQQVELSAIMEQAEALLDRAAGVVLGATLDVSRPESADKTAADGQEEGAEG